MRQGWRESISQPNKGNKTMETQNNRGQYEYFANLPNKTIFTFNGDWYQKVTTRTAKILQYGNKYYFGKRELCVVGRYCRLWNSHGIF